IDSVNKNTINPIVIKSIGGNNGGGTKLTSYGLKMIHMFDTININSWKYLDKQLNKHLNS
ncbi:molybdenum transporter, partial [Tenacibaculum sp.]|nr:molybdenum transporter [Tenacibaculum sp.]